MNRRPFPVIYFMRPVNSDGPVKVGYSIASFQRLKDCNKWSPVELELAAVIPVRQSVNNRKTCSDIERLFHRRYQDHRMHSEWFAAHPQLLEDIAAIKAGTFEMSALLEDA